MDIVVLYSGLTLMNLKKNETYAWTVTFNLLRQRPCLYVLFQEHILTLSTGMEKKVDIFSSIMTKPRGRQQRIRVRCRWFLPAAASRQILALTQRPFPRAAEVKWPKFKVTTPSREAVMNASSYNFISPYFIQMCTGTSLPLSRLGFKGAVTGLPSLLLYFMSVNIIYIYCILGEQMEFWKSQRTPWCASNVSVEDASLFASALRRGWLLNRHVPSGWRVPGGTWCQLQYIPSHNSVDCPVLWPGTSWHKDESNWGRVTKRRKELLTDKEKIWRDVF